jgi:predicted small secreted protein
MALATTVSLNSRVAKALKKRRTDPLLGQGSMGSILAEAIRLFVHKSEHCFSCTSHKDLLVRIEISKQKYSGSLDNSWIAISPEELKIAQDMSSKYGGTSKAVVEQAAIEHLGRPSCCIQCPHYTTMCQAAGVGNRKSDLDTTNDS